MKRSVLVLVFLVGLALLLPPVPAQAEMLGFKVSGAVGPWFPCLTGNAAYKGRSLDFDSDLDLSKRQVEPQAWLRLEHPIPFVPDIKLEYQRLTVTGRSTVDASFTWGDTTYTQGANIEADATMNMLEATLYWHVPLINLTSMGTLDVQYGLALRYFDGEVRITDAATNQSSQAQGRIVLPLLYAGVDFKPIDRLSFSAELRAIGYSSNLAFEVQAAVRFFPLTDWLFVGLGYRYARLDVSDLSDLNIDARLSGPFAEFGFSF